MTPRKSLGRGLDALLGSNKPAPGSTGSAAAADTGHTLATAATIDLPVAALTPGRYQPRQTNRAESLAELADSIRRQGVLQPLIVRVLPARDPDGASHEIVAGERRWRAAQLAELTHVPAIVRELTDQAALAIALIENLQREDLSPIDQANSLSRLATEFELTHHQVAEAVGRSRSSVSNLLRLLELHDDVKELLAAGSLDMGHARALLSLDSAAQPTLARRAVAAGWSVRQVEQKVRAALDTSGAAAATVVDMETRWLQKQLADELGQKVAIRIRKNGGRRLDIDFTDLQQLQGALRKIEELIEQLRTTAGPRVRNAKE